MSGTEETAFKKFPKIADLKPNIVTYPTANIQNLLDFINKREEWSEDTAEKLQKRIDYWEKESKQTGRFLIAQELRELLESLR